MIQSTLKPQLTSGGRTMKPLRRHLAAMLVGLAALPLMAQQASTDMTDGEVRKVDRETNKLTIKHGEIRHLDMPPMTMVFQVKDAALLDKLKAGDKVRFVVERTPGGFVVTQLQPAP